MAIPDASPRPGHDTRMPVWVFSGFLGAGKTTLLKRLLAQPAFADSLLIVNEIGEIGIDHHLLERADDQTILLGNGCVCCVLRGDLQATLVDTDMRRRRGELPDFSRVIVETSGLADPGPIAITLYGDAPLLRQYRLAQVVTLVDPTNAAGRAQAEGLAARQVAAADRIVLTKADRSTPAERRDARDWARSINPHAPLDDSLHGDIAARLLADATPIARIAEATAPDDAGAYLGSRITPHPAGIGSVALTFPSPPERALFREFLDLLGRLRGPDLLRIKGIVRYADAPSQAIAIQGVGHLFDRETTLAPHPSLPTATTLVLIGRHLVHADIAHLWDALCAVASAPPAVPSSPPA